MSDGAPITVPYASPIFGRGPYHMLEARLLMVSWAVPRDVAAQFLPPPLTLPDGPIIAGAFIGDMHQLPSCGKFHEGGVMLPAAYGDSVGTYAAYLWTSADEAIFVGREVYGMPKVLCEDTPHVWNGNQINATVRRSGQEVMGLDLAVEAPVDPGEVMRDGPRLSVRFIPDPTGETGGRRQVLLFSTPDFAAKDAWRGTATLRLPPHAQSRACALLPEATHLTGYAVTASWVLDRATILSDEVY